MPSSVKRTSVERQERRALDRAGREAPAEEPSLAVFGRDVEAYGGQSGAIAPEDSTAQDWLVADAARPDFEDETADGLSSVEEEVRHAAEDLPADEPWQERVRRKAYELWVSEGGPHGRAEDHWRIASELVAEEIARARTDLPYDRAGDEPVEQAALLDNLGEFPELTDQGADRALAEDPGPAEGKEAVAAVRQAPGAASNQPADVTSPPPGPERRRGPERAARAGAGPGARRAGRRT